MSDTQLSFALRLNAYSQEQKDLLSNLWDGGEVCPYEAEAPLHVLQSAFQRDMMRLKLKLSTQVVRVIPVGMTPRGFLSNREPGFWITFSEKEAAPDGFLNGPLDVADFISREEVLTSESDELRAVFQNGLPPLDWEDVYHVQD